jgi:hypothetical protein
VRWELRVRERGGFYDEEMRCMGLWGRRGTRGRGQRSMPPACKGIVYREIDRGTPRQSTTGFLGAGVGWGGGGGAGLCLHALILEKKTVISG